MSGKDSKTWDWYQRLCIAASTAVLQWIMATLGYTESGRKQPSLDDVSIERMFMSIRTPPAQEQVLYPAFQLASVSLDQHIEWESSIPGSRRPQQFTLLQQKAEINNISQTTTSLPAPVLREPLQRSECKTTISPDLDHKLSNLVKFKDVDGKKIIVPGPPYILKLPPAALYLPALNPTRICLVGGKHSCEGGNYAGNGQATP